MSDALSELIGLRVRHELLEQDLSEAIHLLYDWVIWVAKSPTSDFRQQALAMLRAKFLQMPQGWVLGQRLIEMDEQTGRPDVAKGLLHRMKEQLLQESPSYWRDWLLRKVSERGCSLLRRSKSGRRRRR